MAHLTNELRRPQALAALETQLAAQAEARRTQIEALRTRIAAAEAAAEGAAARLGTSGAMDVND